MPDLFDPISFGAIQARNRIVMAPITRGRATRDHVPTPMMADYYRLRADAGLIITEATGVCPQGLGWPYAPGIWSEAQVEAWKPVVDAVHRAGGKIVCQLWHMGRAVHSNFPGRGQPVSASATTAPGLAHTYEGRAPYPEARPLRADEIPALLEDFSRAARNAQRAGFDGVQIHAANGHLIDQFLRDGTNFRTDDYGGSIDNRGRLLREVAKAVVDTIGAARTIVRLSPNGERQGVKDSNPLEVFTRAAGVLSDMGIAFLEIRESDPKAPNGALGLPAVGRLMRAAFKGTFVISTDYDRAQAQAALDAGRADAVSIGRKFISNPDLVRRFQRGLPLTPDDPETWYTQGPQGYLDYALAT